MNVFFVSGTQTLLNTLQEITGRDKSTPTANSHTPSKLSSYCSPNTQEASMLCYCWMTRWQVRDRNQVEKESGIWEARERNQSASATCSQTLILISSLWLNQSREDTGIHLQTGRCRGWWEKQQQGQWWGECQKLADVKRFALVAVEVSTFHYNVWFETP